MCVWGRISSKYNDKTIHLTRFFIVEFSNEPESQNFKFLKFLCKFRSVSATPKPLKYVVVETTQGGNCQRLIERLLHIFLKKKPSITTEKFIHLNFLVTVDGMNSRV